MSENSGERPAIMDLLQERVQKALLAGNSVEVCVVRSEDFEEIRAHMRASEKATGLLVDGHPILSLKPGDCWIFGYPGAGPDVPRSD